MSLSLIALALATVQAPPAPPPGIVRRDPDRVQTRAEFMAAAAARFERVDANRDGRIDRAERQTARAAMRERRHERRAERRERRLERGDDRPAARPAG